MSELTPERIRDAAEVVGLLSREHAYYQLTHPWSQISLRNAADKLEREQAAEAKREKRIQELVWLMFKRDCPESNGPTGIGYRKYAEAVIEAFPVLMEGVGDE